MNFKDLNEGYVYFLADVFCESSFVKEKEKGFFLMPKKQSNNGTDTYRPYLCLKKDYEDGLVWLAPVSSSQVKYNKIINNPNSTFARDNIIVDIAKNNFVSLSKAFPVCSRVVDKLYIDTNNNMAYRPCYATFRYIQRKFNKKLHLHKHYSKNVFSNDITDFLEYAYIHDYRAYQDLSFEERKRVIDNMYETSVLKQAVLTGDKATELEERNRINNVLMKRKDISINPHTFEHRNATYYTFGTKRFTEAEKKDLYYLTYNSGTEMLTYAHALERANIPYSAIVKESDNGRISLRKTDVDEARKAISDCKMYVRKPLGTITYTTAHSDKCVQLSQGISFKTSICVARALKSSRVPFRIDVSSEGVGTLSVFTNDIDRVNGVFRDLQRSAKRTLDNINLQNTSAIMP